MANDADGKLDVVMTSPLMTLLRIVTPAARTSRLEQLTVFESMTVFAAVIVQGPV
jgi:hypothetical protein